MKVVDFYFDYLSPFAYLASLEAPALCGSRGAVLRFRPVLFAGLLNHWGQLGPAEIPPKAIYTFRSCLRYATLRGIPFRTPRYHPFKPLAALRATLSAASDDERAQVVRVLFHVGWGEGGDLGDPSEVAAALSRAGLDGPALLERGGSESTKRLLKDETDAAIARGVFGIPTMFVDDELFWGLDQLEYLSLYLEGRDPLAGIDWSILVPQGATARRPKAGA